MNNERVQRLREEFGIGAFESKKAIEIADARFGGNDRLGALWIHANALAINVRGGREARDAWNEAWARRTYAQRYGSDPAA